jgi:curved DNA-binding protein CbpA
MIFGNAAVGPRSHPDLLALGLDRMPSSSDELRRAYRSATRKAHPDVRGGGQQAFLAVAGAFERLSEKLGRRST